LIGRRLQDHRIGGLVAVEIHLDELAGRERLAA
jgi:hypothetical protein